MILLKYEFNNMGFCGPRLLNIYLFLLFIGSVFTIIKLEPEINPEKLIQSTKSRYLKMMIHKPDWLKRILEIVKIELKFRQTMNKCKTENCMYSIKYQMPMKQIRFKRSIKKKGNIKFLSLFKEIDENSTIIQTLLYKKPTQITSKPFIQITTLSSNDHMKECQGNYTSWCKNGAKCVYVDLLEEAVCICRKGFTGERCIYFSLPDTVQSLRFYDKEQVNISSLNVKEYESIISVMDATARFTYDAILQDQETVKEILDYTSINEG